MAKHILARTSLTLVMLACAVVSTRIATGSVTAPQSPNSSLKLFTIYSNLGPPLATYDGKQAWIVSGPRSEHLQWVAMAFRPDFDAKITEIAIAVQHIRGTNAVTLTLNQDRNGIPGKVEHIWHLRHLPKYGQGCCLLDIAHDAQGVAVQKGELYWIVARTDSSNANADDTWQYTRKDRIADSVAVKSGSSGWIRLKGFLGAYAVYGTRR